MTENNNTESINNSYHEKKTHETYQLFDKLPECLIFGARFKSILKFDTDKNKLYIKFHKNGSLDDVAEINDNLFVEIQNSGYTLAINKDGLDLDIVDGEKSNTDTLKLSLVRNSKNVYVIEFDSKNLATLNDPESLNEVSATYKSFIIGFTGEYTNEDAKYVTFSTVEF